MEGQQFNITEGNNGSITCTATGYPVPTVVWQNSDGSSLSNNRLVSGSPVISSTGVGNVSSVSVELMVIGAMRIDSGMYKCSASNSLISISRNITITVQPGELMCSITYIQLIYLQLRQPVLDNRDQLASKNALIQTTFRGGSGGPAGMVWAGPLFANAICY